MSPTRAASVLLLLIASTRLSGQVSRVQQSTNLAGTSWQLVRFEGGDGTTLTPDVRSKYTIAFESDGRFSARIDCNRANGTWSSIGANQLTFGPLAVTRVLCPPGSLYNQMVRQWPYVRSYVMRNGHLFLSLAADGGIYEFEPLNAVTTAAGPIRGTATYRERVALPRQAVFEATLEDVSRAGASSELIARVRNEQPGSVPIPFTIAYDPARVVAGRNYVVTARILVDDRVWFVTDRNYPVITRGQPSEVQLILRRTSGQTLPGRVQPPATLENTNWNLTYLGNTAVVADPGRPQPNIVLHSQNATVAGSGGCNRFSGTYSLNGDRVSFSRVASTMMACTSGTDTEQTFFRALSNARRWRISGQNLELLDDRGNSLARFETAYLR